MPNDLREALAASGVAPLIQKQIDPMLLEYMRRYSPLVRALPSKEWGSNVYFYNERTAKPAGGFVADGGARPVTSSTYVQNSFTIRLLQNVGAVTGFAQAVTRDLIGDLKAREIDGAVAGLLWDIETALIWGNDAATSYTGGQYPQFDGYDAQVATFTGANQNAIDFHAALTLAALDELIDLVEEQAAMPAQGDMWMLVMSPRAQSKIAQLLTNQQRFVDQVEVAAGLITPSYRDIPIIKSSFLSPRTQVVGTVTSATATTGGTLAAATYHYRVSAVVARFGEIAACADVSQASTGSTSTITLTLPTVSGPDGAGPIAWRVYRGSSSSNQSLLAVVDAYDATGAATTTITDTGAACVANSNTLPATYTGTNANIFPRQQQTSSQSADEDIYLVPRDPDFSVRPYVRDITVLNLSPTTSAPDTLPFAVVSDTCLAIRAPKYSGRLARVQASI
jgi:Phage capsid family